MIYQKVVMTAILKLLNQYYHKKDNVWIQAAMEDKPYCSSYE